MTEQNKLHLEQLLPAEIEKRSFEIIGEELKARQIELLPEQEAVIKRAIHTTADFDYAKNLQFSSGAVFAAIEALRQGCSIVTDTNMARAGINQAALAQLGGRVLCFMGDEDVARAAKEAGTTRATASMEKAAASGEDFIYAVGNAPTALIRLYELVKEGRIHPKLIIGVPVGFVNVEPSKEWILTLKDTPYIVARGRKGGSNVAAAICNALLYQATGRVL
ncbi:MAG: precorrin-8X methylmutase [bacterium]|nr:precorrin-8X methylmutase [bacterium]